MIALLALFACEEELACTDLYAFSVTATVASAGGGALENVVGSYTVDGGEAKACEDFGQGDFVCGGEEKGHFVVTFEADGHEAQTQEVDVAADECHVIGEQLAFELEPTACTEEEVPAVIVNLSSELDADATLENPWVSWQNPNTDMAPQPCDQTDAYTFACAAEYVGEIEILAGGDYHATELRGLTTVLTADECHVETQTLDLVLLLPDC